MEPEGKNKNQNNENGELMPSLNTERKPGGLYRNIKMSVKSANILVAVLCIALIFTIIYLVNHNGFTVKFDTDGGSQVESQKVLHSETLQEPPEPQKEGYIFTGWYADKACTVKWDMKNDVVTNSMTLYAGWQKKVP